MPVTNLFNNSYVTNTIISITAFSQPMHTNQWIFKVIIIIILNIETLKCTTNQTIKYAGTLMLIKNLRTTKKV